jgi:predicted alternative tryptophan synthase beta-subunit
LRLFRVQNCYIFGAGRWVYPYWRYECVSLGLDRDILLTEDQTPKKRYCILTDLPKTLQPVLTPETLEPVDSKMLEAVFPGGLLKQEMSGVRFVQIPEEKRDTYR